MSTDRELLELAAKATGDFFPPPRDWAIPECLPVIFTMYGAVWNPREDDGDAFRLLVALSLKHDGLSVGLNSTQKGQFQVFPSYDTHASASFEVIGKDPFQSFREAIFQQAVKIGRAMQ